jgi:hypothetical protein
MREAASHALEHHEPVTGTGIPNKKVLMWAMEGPGGYHLFPKEEEE